MKLKIKRFDVSLPLPEVERDGAVCFDLYPREDVTIQPGDIKPAPLNIAVAVPDGYVLLLFVRSGTPQKHGVILANGVGVIDPFFSGDKDELVALLLNMTKTKTNIPKGTPIVQAMLQKVETIKWDEVDKMGSKGEGYWSAN